LFKSLIPKNKTKTDLRKFLTQALKQTAIYAVLFLRRFIAALDLSSALRYNGKQNIFIENGERN